MKSGIAAKIAAIPVFSILLYGASVQGNAAQVVDRLVLEEAAAGAAEYVEFNIEPTPEEVAEIIAQNNAWKNPGSIVMADVYSSVNVRTEPSEDAELAGKLYKDCGGYILVQRSEYHSFSDDPDSYYTDLFPVSSPEEADELKTRIHEWVRQKKFAETGNYQRDRSYFNAPDHQRGMCQ